MNARLAAIGMSAIYLIGIAALLAYGAPRHHHGCFRPTEIPATWFGNCR